MISNISGSGVNNLATTEHRETSVSTDSVEPTPVSDTELAEEATPSSSTIVTLGATVADAGTYSFGGTKKPPP